MFVSSVLQCLASAAVVYVGGTTAHGQSAFNVLDLGTINGAGTYGYAVNSSGQAAGFSDGSNQGSEQAYRTAANSAINATNDLLDTLGGTYSQAYGLNDSGQAVGLAGISGNFFYHAFRTGPNAKINRMTSDLGTLSGLMSSFSQAQAANVHGQVVGWSDTTGAHFWPAHAFRTAANSPINGATDDLGTFGGSYSEARDINSLGQVAGFANLAGDTVHHAFRTAANAAINPATDDLGTLGGTHSVGRAINEQGQVAGESQVAGSNAWHAFRTAPNTAINPAADDLGTLGGPNSRATDINNSGKVVGFSDVPGGGRHAFFFDGATMHDLNDLIDPASGWVLTEARGLNDNCQITGAGTVGDDPTVHAFLLTPVSGTCELPDFCPEDPTKLVPGQCGCGVPDDDSDEDGVADCNDLCPDTPPGTPIDADGCPHVQPGDFDGDGDVDKGDLDEFLGCALGPEVPMDDPICGPADLDGDGDGDQTDFGLFQGCISGAGVEADPDCVN